MPFEAVTAFFDPAVQFGFQFETDRGRCRKARGIDAEGRRPKTAKPSAAGARRKSKEPRRCRRRNQSAERTGGGGEVVQARSIQKEMKTAPCAERQRIIGHRVR